MVPLDPVRSLISAIGGRREGVYPVLPVHFLSYNAREGASAWPDRQSRAAHCQPIVRHWL
jgi:hypothetical protein